MWGCGAGGARGGRLWAVMGAGRRRLGGSACVSFLFPGNRARGWWVGGEWGPGAVHTVRLVARCCIAGLLLGSNGCLVCAGRNLCVSSVESAAGPRAECVCVCVGVGWSTMEYGVSEYHPTTPVSFRLRSQIPGFIQYGCTLCREASGEGKTLRL